MNYNYYAKQDYYAYLAGGVQAWDLLLPNNIGLKKGDTVTVIETYDNGDETGRATTGNIVFNGVDGIMTVNGNKDFYYINNLTTTNMYKVFRATLTQTGTAIPVASILENTTGLVPVLSRDDIGFYGIDNLGIVNAEKVIILFSTTNDASAIQLAVPLQNAHEVSIQTLLGIGNPSDDILTSAGIEIKIFP